MTCFTHYSKLLFWKNQCAKRSVFQWQYFWFDIWFSKVNVVVCGRDCHSVLWPVFVLCVFLASGILHWISLFYHTLKCFYHHIVFKLIQQAYLAPWVCLISELPILHLVFIFHSQGPTVLAFRLCCASLNLSINQSSKQMWPQHGLCHRRYGTLMNICLRT